MAHGDLGEQANDGGANEPQDIAAAFQLLKQQREDSLDDEVDGGEEDPEGDSVQPDDGEAGADWADDGDDAEPQVGGDDVVHADGGAAGGPADDLDELPEAVDYGQVSRSLVNEINRSAAQAANRIFQDKGIKKFGIGDLYRRDEQSGVVVFQNPDNPNRPFESRAEAQSWVDAMNKQIDDEWRNVAIQEQQRIAKEAAPRLRLVQFAPKYEKMDEEMQELFDDVIEGYEVRDRQGRVVGYSCDLDAAYAQAKKIKAMIDKRNPRQNDSETDGDAASQAQRPATDMRTGKVEKTEDKEPTSLEEAMAMYNRQRKAGRK